MSSVQCNAGIRQSKVNVRMPDDQQSSACVVQNNIKRKKGVVILDCTACMDVPPDIFIFFREFHKTLCLGPREAPRRQEQHAPADGLLIASSAPFMGVSIATLQSVLDCTFS